MPLLPRQLILRYISRASLALAFALVQSHIIAVEFPPDKYRASVAGAFGVVTGHPYWKEFQSRVLSPYIVLWISRITHNYLTAHFIFGLLALTAAGYLAWELGLRVGGISSPQ